MSKKGLTHYQVREMKIEFHYQMNILNGNAELDQAVTKYVNYLEERVSKFERIMQDARP